MDEEQQDAAVRRIHDRMARTYDASFSQSVQGDRLRGWVQEQLRMRFRPGDRVLDIGCGTGTDAIFLAKHGVHLTSLDISSCMVETAAAKVRAAGVEDRVQVGVLDFRNLPPPDHLFDGAFSNFDTLNYADDLSGFADRIGGQLRPGAPLLCLLLNPLCLWEIVYFLLSLQPVRAFRRLTQRGRDLMVGQEPLALTLYYPRALVRKLARDFRLRGITGTGIFLPPAGFRGESRLWQPAIPVAAALERATRSRYPFYNFCDHYLIDLERKGRAS